EGRLLGLFFAGVKEDNLIFREEADGLFRWTKANVQMVKYPYTDDVKAFIVFEDIHEERSAIVELAERASHDAMTNLLNREAALRMGDERIEAMGASDRCAVFMIDLDNFKQINDSLGHLQGDDALIAASNTMRSALRDDDIIGRMGGDEFFIFLSGNVTPRSAAKTAKRLISALEVSCGFLRLTASVGVTVARKTDNVTCRELYAAADRALYEAKRAGKNKYYLTEWPVQ
ncbi:MAG: GGDEF domain-containing protein, partial [Cloacibacillus sp.]